MTPEERKDFLRRNISEIFNQGDTAACDELYAPHCTFHYPTFAVDGVQGLKEFVRELRQANPDLHVNIHDVAVDGDLLAARWTMAGTAHGEFRGIPATGRTWVMSGMNLARWEADKVVEEWGNYDMLGLLQQLGAAPAMAPQQGE